MLQKSRATEIMNKLNVCTFFACKRFLHVRNKTPNMLFTENWVAIRCSLQLQLGLLSTG